MIKQGYQYVLCLQLFATAVIHGTDEGGNIQEKPETESSEDIVLAKSKLEVRRCLNFQFLGIVAGPGMPSHCSPNWAGAKMSFWIHPSPAFLRRFYQQVLVFCP